MAAGAARTMGAGTMTVDFRTRTDGERRDVDAVDFFVRELPALFAEHGGRIPGAAEFELRPLIVHVDDAAWLVRRDGNGFVVCPHDVPAGEDVIGLERAVEVRLTPDQVTDLVVDQVTPIGLMTAGRLDLVRGRIGRLLDWWLVWRSLLDGTTIHRRGAVDLPVDLDRSFTLDDDPDEILHFLETAGFLHLRGVFSDDEMALISADMDAAAPSYTPEDGNSWWATLADGSERVVRMQRFEAHSPAVAALLTDPRFLRISEITGCGHTVDWAMDNRIEALFKPLGVVSGISDVPWHKDCSLGRHSYECCALTVGISVTGGGETSGQLRVIAGSHRALVWPSLLDTTDLGLPDVALPTETGDVTVHLSCTLHMAQAPTERERRVLYTGFRLPSRGDEAAERAANRRLLRASREGAPRNTSQRASV